MYFKIQVAKVCILLTIFLLKTTAVFSQETTGGFFGKVIDLQTQKPLSQAVVSIQNVNLTQFTLADGSFYFGTNITGKQLLLIRNQGYKDVLIAIEIISNEWLNIGTIVLEQDIEDYQENAVLLTTNDLEENGTDAETLVYHLQASKDAFQQAVAFNWSSSYFKMRGLDSKETEVLFNGISMNKIYNGRPQRNNWGGVNEMIKNQYFTFGTTASDYSFGHLLGTQMFDTRASLYKKGTKISFTASNASYNWQTAVKYASGWNKKGWAMAVFASKREAQNGYFEGTNFEANSFFVSVQKSINENQSLNFTGIYTPNSRSLNAPNTDEVVEMMSEKYNPNWGFQKGKKRNARVKTVDEPILIVNHFLKINKKIDLTSGFAYQFGKTSNTNIDYQQADDWKPTYYKKMPSFYSSHYANDVGEFPGAFMPDFENAQKNRDQFLNNSQINWESMYFANQKPVQVPELRELKYEPAQSHYILYENRADDNTLTASLILNAPLSENNFLTAGISFKNYKSHQYKKLLDLLGGAYFKDVDSFYKGSKAESDLNNPNRKVIAGDIYGYNFNYFGTSANAFTQFRFNYQNIDLYLAQNFSKTSYQRKGLYKNGIYAHNSFGKSNIIDFENFGFKAGLVYKISGKQFLLLNTLHQTNPPTLQNVFSNARLSNSIVDDIKSETQSSFDLSYNFQSSKLKTRITGYFSETTNTTQISFYYAEGIFEKETAYSSTNAFVNQIATGFNKQNIGVEFSLEYPIFKTLKILFAGNYGQYLYKKNPNLTLINDANVTENNPHPSVDFGQARIKNYKQAGAPQQAFSLGLEYRDPKFWWFAANVNYLEDNYVDIALISRTDAFYKNPNSSFLFPEITKSRAKELLQQEKLDSVLLINVLFGKSAKIFKKQLGIFASVNNLLGSVYKTGGYEQPRKANYRKLNQDLASGTPNFGNKYFYGYGRTFFLNINFSL